MKLISLIQCALLLLLPSSVVAGTVAVAVAANFTRPMNEIAAEFSRQTGHDTRLSFGSSGKLFAQITNGAPFELFLSADREKPRILANRGLAVAGSRFTYALGALVLWSPETSPAENVETRLKKGDFDKLAIANPRLAPYGRAAMDVLDNLAISGTLRGRIVQGENIAQTYQFVSSGNAQLGFVALSQVFGKNVIARGSGWVVPPALYRPVKQDAVLLIRGENNSAAGALAAFLQSDDARAIITSYGYGLPEGE